MTGKIVLDKHTLIHSEKVKGVKVAASKMASEDRKIGSCPYVMVQCCTNGVEKTVILNSSRSKVVMVRDLEEMLSHAVWFDEFLINEEKLDLADIVFIHMQFGKSVELHYPDNSNKAVDRNDISFATNSLSNIEIKQLAARIINSIINKSAAGSDSLRRAS